MLSIALIMDDKTVSFDTIEELFFSNADEFEVTKIKTLEELQTKLNKDTDFDLYDIIIADEHLSFSEDEFIKSASDYIYKITLGQQKCSVMILTADIDPILPNQVKSKSFIFCSKLTIEQYYKKIEEEIRFKRSQGGLSYEDFSDSWKA